MNLNDKIGFEVTTIAGATGFITKYEGNYITIGIGKIEKVFTSDAFVSRRLTFVDPASQSEVEAEIREIAENRRKAEEEHRMDKIYHFCRVSDIRCRIVSCKGRTYREDHVLGIHSG